MLVLPLHTAKALESSRATGGPNLTNCDHYVCWFGRVSSLKRAAVLGVELTLHALVTSVVTLKVSELQSRWPGCWPAIGHPLSKYFKNFAATKPPLGYNCVARSCWCRSVFVRQNSGLYISCCSLSNLPTVLLRQMFTYNI